MILRLLCTKTIYTALKSQHMNVYNSHDTKVLFAPRSESEISSTSFPHSNHKTILIFFISVRSFQPNKRWICFGSLDCPCEQQSRCFHPELANNSISFPFSSTNNNRPVPTVCPGLRYILRLYFTIFYDNPT